MDDLLNEVIRYPWSNGKAINTMTLEKSFIASEDEGKINWDANDDVMYAVVNKDAPNKYGEYKSYKIMPGESSNPTPFHYQLTIL